MTDEEIVRALAGKVMGWVHNGAGQWALPRSKQEGNTLEVTCDFHQFNPLTSDADSCAVLDKMVADKWRISLVYGNILTPGTWTCLITRAKMWSEPEKPITNTDRRRAIAIAALKAVGAYDE